MIQWIYANYERFTTFPITYTTLFSAFITRTIAKSGQNTFMPIVERHSLSELGVLWAANDSGGSERSDIQYTALIIGY